MNFITKILLSLFCIMVLSLDKDILEKKSLYRKFNLCYRTYMMN